MIMSLLELYFSGESWGLTSLVLVLVNDCRSDVSPVINSDSELLYMVTLHST